MGIEDLTRTPEHERNRDTFLLELENISRRYPELIILGINEAEITQRISQDYISESKNGHSKRLQTLWNLSQHLDESSAEKSVAFVYMRGDGLIARAAQKEIDELALKHGSTNPDNPPINSAEIVHFLGYEFRS